MSILNDKEIESGLREIVIPLSPADLNGPSVIGVAQVLSTRDDTGVASIERMTSEVNWVGESDWVYFVSNQQGQIFALRLATDEDSTKYRIPAWIQNEEIPECCGLPMYFVGQIDDDDLCTEAPPGAKYWWHDSASFYVFTCSQCLGVKAVGQQC